MLLGDMQISRGSLDRLSGVGQFSAVTWHVHNFKVSLNAAKCVRMLRLTVHWGSALESLVSFQNPLAMRADPFLVPMIFCHCRESH